MYYLGIDLGGTNIAVGIVDENFNIVIKDKVPTGAGRDADLVIDDMAKLAKELCEKSGISFDEIAYAGIAAPGTVDPANG